MNYDFTRIAIWTYMPTPRSDDRKERQSGNPKSSVHAHAKKVRYHTIWAFEIV